MFKVNLANDWIRTADLWYQKRQVYQLSHCPELQILYWEAVWPDLAKFHSFGNMFKAYFVFSSLWHYFYTFGQIFIAVNGQILKIHSFHMVTLLRSQFYLKSGSLHVSERASWRQKDMKKSFKNMNWRRQRRRRRRDGKFNFLMVLPPQVFECSIFECRADSTPTPTSSYSTTFWILKPLRDAEIWTPKFETAITVIF